jgi:SPP1 gp7 family putative phage head morphogenesis protein
MQLDLFPTQGVVRTADIRLTARQRARQREYFAKVRNAESAYARALRRIARSVGDIVRSMYDYDAPMQSASEINQVLSRYADILRPWARAHAARMIAEVARRDETAWAKAAREMGRELRAEIRDTPIGDEVRRILAEQTALITSIPQEAARRVQDLAVQAVTKGTRNKDLVAMILDSPNVTVSRANLIARTETAKAASALTQARAKYVGAEGYIWHTAKDAFVRKEHRKLEGTLHRWNDPPIAEANGERHHPGEFPNCFIGSTPVDLRFGCRTLWRAFYNGPLVSFVIGSEIIESTPNHPILTPYGWVPAYMLNRGDEIICMTPQSNNAVRTDKYKSVTTFDEFYRSVAGESSRRDIFGFDFHGDIIDGNVDQITIDDCLSFDTNAAASEDIAEFALGMRNSRVCRNTVICCKDHIRMPYATCFSNSVDMRSTGFVSSDDLIGFYLSSEIDSATLQTGDNRVAGTVKLISQSLKADAPCVELGYDSTRQSLGMRESTYALSSSSIDAERTQFMTKSTRATSNDSGRVGECSPCSYEVSCVVEKRSREFSGHVYTFESYTGYYPVGIGKIIAKNCRCWAEPIIPATR